MKEFTCYQCGATSSHKSSHVNRSRRLGLKLFCSKVCFGLSRRKNRSVAEKKELKRAYDIEYRKRNPEERKLSRAAYYQSIKERDREKHRAYRQKNMARHVEYCRRPEYRAKKHEYDCERYAREKFGPYWESHIAIMAIDREVVKHMSKYEIRLKNGTLNKALRRIRNGKTKRSYA